MGGDDPVRLPHLDESDPHPTSLFQMAETVGVISRASTQLLPKMSKHIKVKFRV